MSVTPLPPTLPSYDKRTVILGSTGSGKTQFAIWLLMMRIRAMGISFRPIIVFDFKGDELIAELGATEISIFGNPPKKPGLYVVRPIPELHDDAVTAFLWKCWKQEDMLIYVDEGYMLGTRNPALNALLTQGRSKHIEMMILSQRPRWMSKFVFSEANFFAVMNLNLLEDRRYVSSYIGGHEINLLPPYHSLWYHADLQRANLLKPVPKASELMMQFEALFSRRRTAL